MKILFLLLIPFIFAFSSCSQEEGRTLSILTYNMYLLFDDVEDGDEFHPFTRSGGYGREEYIKRIDSYRDFFLSDEGSADIYILSEIESENVLEDLIKGKMAKKGYKYYGIIDNDNPISVGFISNVYIDDIKVHSNAGPRDILELDFFLDGSQVRIFALHAKSRIDGGDEQRRLAFEHLSMLMTRSHPILTIAAGDFNEDPRYGPDFLDVKAGIDSALKVTGDPALLNSETFYCSSLDPDSIDPESYYYDGRWYSYDNILLSAAAFDGIGLEYVKSFTLAPFDGISADGTPIRFEVESCSGYSDHLAVKTILEYH